MKKINTWFECINCWFDVPPSNKTCRNHCPNCFVSLHVDQKIPWDRLSQCKWIMYPIEYIYKPWKTKILFKCSKCWKLHRNIQSFDDQIDKLPKLIQKYKKYFTD